MIIATTLTITAMATTESEGKSEIGSMEANKFAAIFPISDSSSPPYFHYFHHPYPQHYRHHHFYYYYHNITNKYLCFCIYICIY